MPIRLLIHGCAGRMGQAVLTAAPQHKKLCVVGGAERAGHAILGQALAGRAALAAPLSAFVGERVDGVVDFSTPPAAAAAAQFCAQQNWFLVSGTTGLAAAHSRALQNAARTVPILQAGNMSLAVHVLAQAVRQSANLLPPDWDVEIVETHHRDKRDAPSGTALLLADAVTQGRQKNVRAALGRRGARRGGEIGLHAVRGGNLIGRHEVLFAGAGESLRLTHEAQEREIFADGALRAAAWLHRKPPGLYRFTDMLARRRAK